MRDYSLASEADLVSRLQSGDEWAFTEIYNRYWERLLAIGYYHTQNKQAAEDVVHEVMMSLWMRKDQLQIESLNAYLGTAVKFAVFKSIVREKRRHQILEEKEPPEAITDIEQQLDAKFLEAYLKGVVEQLPEKARMVFHYSRNEQLSVRAIAHKLAFLDESLFGLSVSQDSSLPDDFVTTSPRKIHLVRNKFLVRLVGKGRQSLAP